MKLSEAIREGAKLHPQGFINLFYLDREGCITASCALGAALVVNVGEEATRQLHYESSNLAWAKLEEIYPELNNFQVADGKRSICLAQHIWRLNDVQELTREEIADRVESLGF